MSEFVSNAAHRAAAKALAIYDDAAISDDFIDALDDPGIRSEVRSRRDHCREVLAERGEWPPLAPGDTVDLTGELLPRRTGGTVVKVGVTHGCKVEVVTVDWPADPEFESQAGVKGLPEWKGAIHHRTDLHRAARPIRRYAVEVERIATVTVYVTAPDIETARSEALRLAREDDKFENAFDEAVYTASASVIERWPLDDPYDDTYWTGGPNGEWREFTEDTDPDEEASDG